MTPSLLKVYRKFGPVVRQKYGPVNIVQLFDVKVCDPRCLATSTGPKQRPAFLG